MAAVYLLQARDYSVEGGFHRILKFRQSNLSRGGIYSRLQLIITGQRH